MWQGKILRSSRKNVLCFENFEWLEFGPEKFRLIVPMTLVPKSLPFLPHNPCFRIMFKQTFLLLDESKTSKGLLCLRKRERTGTMSAFTLHRQMACKKGKKRRKKKNKLLLSFLQMLNRNVACKSPDLPHSKGHSIHFVQYGHYCNKRDFRFKTCSFSWQIFLKCHLGFFSWFDLRAFSQYKFHALL